MRIRRTHRCAPFVSIVSGAAAPIVICGSFVCSVGARKRAFVVFRISVSTKFET